MTQNTSKPTSISQQHWVEWTEASGISPEITAAAIKSCDDFKKIAAVLGWERYAHSPGWIVKGVDPLTGESNPASIQFKPDKPFQDTRDSNKKPAKYLTSKRHGYDALCLQIPSDEDYWSKIVDDVSIPIAITEGAKKAGTGLTQGLPTISIPGKDMWHKKGSKELVPSLAAFTQPGRIINLVPDADWQTNNDVFKSFLELGKTLQKSQCQVFVVTWDLSLGKGMDDFIVNNGDDAFKQRLVSAESLQNWEKQFSKSSPRKGTDKAPNSIEVAQSLAEKYQPLWKYDLEQEVWRKFDGKKWATIKDSFLEYLVYQEMKTSGIEYSKPSFISDAIKILKCELLVANWSEQMFDRKQWIPFSNGVLEISTGKMHEHFPGFMNTSCLNHDYHPVENPDNKPIIDVLKENCPHIYTDWMRSQSGSNLRTELLLAVINGILKWRLGFELQKFVHVTGKPRTGKGVYTRIVQKIIGKDNYTGTNPQALGERCGLAEIIDKQLVTIPDIRTTVPTEKLLMLTGGDEISYRQLYKAGTSKRFDGALLLTSNDPIFHGNTTGIDERLIMLQFDNPVPETKRNSLVEEQFDKEIPKLISVALMMSDARVTQLLKSTGDAEIPEYKALAWQHKITQDSVAAFLNEKVVRAENQSIKSSDCYELYKLYCGEMGRKPISMVSFKKHLIEDLCQSWWGWNEVDFKRAETSVLFRGIDVRRDGASYRDIPTLDIQLDPSLAMPSYRNTEAKKPNPLPCMGAVGLEDDFGDQAITLSEGKQLKNPENFLPLNPTYPTAALPSKDFNPTGNPTSTLHSCRVDAENEPILDRSEVPKVVDVRTDVGLSASPVGLPVGLNPALGKAAVGYVGLEGETFLTSSDRESPEVPSLPTIQEWADGGYRPLTITYKGQRSFWQAQISMTAHKEGKNRKKCYFITYSCSGNLEFETADTKIEIQGSSLEKLANDCAKKLESMDADLSIELTS